MIEIDFSHMSDIQRPDAWKAALAGLLESDGVQVRDSVYSWWTAWSDLVRVALYGIGPDVSEIGSTWLGDLSAMNKLHQFTAEELGELAGPGVFQKPAWMCCRVSLDRQVLAVPWLMDTRLVFYRRDLLLKAGVDETSAFESYDGLVDTIHRLGNYGVPIPFAMTFAPGMVALQTLASFVWQAGGDFISPDGKTFLLNQPRARQGMLQYFELGRLVSPGLHDLLSAGTPEKLYYDEQAAIIVHGPWFWRENGLPPALRERTGMAFPPGVPFVGGSNLVVWKHTTHLDESLALVRALASQPLQRLILETSSSLPARLDVLTELEAQGDRFFRILNQGFRRGRSFQLFNLWGLVEERLCKVIGPVWRDVLAQPGARIESILDQHINPLARQLDLVLGSNNSPQER